MRLLTARLDAGATTAAALVDGRWHRLEAPHVGAVLRLAGSPDALAATVETLVTGDRLDGSAVACPAPVVPDPAKVICCGHNYRSHILELGHDVPTHPTLFTKFADTLTGATDDLVVPPDVAGVDWEAELAVVVGAVLHRATPHEARAGIAGFTVANDLSVRQWQRHTAQWLPGKAFDATTPLGPLLVTPDEADPGAGLTIRCTVDGEVVQDADTSDLVFDTGRLLAYVSAFTTLRPGDVVLTGTPGGVGAARIPARWLEDGAVVETSIERIGTLRNVVRRGGPPVSRSLEEGRPAANRG